MLMKYRASLACALALALLSAGCGAFGWWRPAWVAGALALAVSQVARHFNSMVTVRGVQTVLRRQVDGLGLGSSTGGATDGDVLTDTHRLVKHLNQIQEDRARLESQTLRQVAAEVRLLRLRDEGTAQ